MRGIKQFIWTFRWFEDGRPVGVEERIKSGAEKPEIADRVIRTNMRPPRHWPRATPVIMAREG